MHVFFWILNSGKTFIFYFFNYFLFYGQFLIFGKDYFAFFFQSSHQNYLLFLVRTSGSTY
ncbi:hypothetical protein TSAR_015501 [Trichomalopsis sarcophagae]|uniref:Uncharacterized protein n=1 Tax=Trichomalopsis sarcophagae TaxID=543379 RepID=A0A232ERY4_9HYME|nr:hypothetical protein TSAR_015501 [Trichomalopsis sarcophagae]